MTRDEVIQRYCKLSGEVVSSVTGYDQPNDCFCGEGGFWEIKRYAEDPDSYQNSGVALEWIERVVREAIAAHVAGKSAPV